MRKIVPILTLALLFASASLFAQKSGYNIKVKLQNSQDTSLLLVSYYGNTNQIKDTAYLHNGSYDFKGKEALKGGIYLVVFQNKQYFEMIVDKEQHFSMETDPTDPVNKMKVKNSKDNEAFYEYMLAINKLGRKDKKLNDEYKEAEGDKAKQDELKEKIKVVNEDVKSLKLSFIDNHKGSLFAKVLLASKEPDVPKVLPKKEDGSDDSTYIYRYFKEHFFDGFDFADERLLRTPIYASKIKRYFTKILVQRPDTLIKESIGIIEKAKPNKETYKYCIWYFTYVSETSQIMGMDEVFVALGKKYYLTGEAYWVNDKVLSRMTKRINTLDKLLIGKKAPNMIMQDTLLNLRGLHDIIADYTIVIFWDPDCGHCKHEIHALEPWYKENGEKYNTKIFGICTDTNMVKWKAKIREYKIQDWINVDGPRSLTPNYHDLYDIISTPTIYLLDKDKNILAKRLSWNQTTEFIKREYEKGLKKEDE